MAIKAGGLKRKSKAASEIPSSSLADMAFLLLIFFMVSTTFRKEQDRDVTFPEAEATKKMDNPKLLIVLRGDVDVPYRFIDAVQKELQEAAAVRVTFYTNVERRMLRER